jgi:hypothetical protein
MEPLKNAIVFGVAHYFLQITVYVCALAFGPTMVARRVLGISFYDVAVVITFPFVYLAEHFRWKGLGVGAFFLNSIVWSTAVYFILLGKAKLAIMKRQ